MRARRAARCGCTPTTSTPPRGADDPEAALARRLEVGRQSGVPEAALAALRRAGQGHARPGVAARDRARPRRWSTAWRSRPTSGTWTVYETPGPRALARLPVPARAAAADLRRPRPGADLAVLRLRLDARSGRRVPRLAGHASTSSTRGWRCRVTASRSSTCTATSRATGGSSPSGWRRSLGARSPRAAHGGRDPAPSVYGETADVQQRRGCCPRRSATCATWSARAASAPSRTGGAERLGRSLVDRRRSQP